MSIRKGSKIIAGNNGGSGGDSTVNQNPYSDIRRVYDWIGTLEEYERQDIDNTHPEWVCYVTDDTDIVMSGEKLKTIASNCIVEEPENIKLSLVNGVLTVLAGSKLYIPDGFEANGITRKYTEVILDKNIVWDDKGLIGVGAYTYNYMITIAIDNHYPWYDRHFASFGINNQSSIFSTMETPNTYVSENAIWYDFVNNYMKCTHDHGQTWEICQVALPICIASITGTGVEGELPIVNSVIESFSKFGYIDTIIYALPNLKLLLPDGRNEDGSLKNIELITDYVSIYNNKNAIQSISNFGFTDYRHPGSYGNLFNEHEYNLCRSGRGFKEVDKLPKTPKGLDSTQRYYVKSENKFYEAGDDSWEEQKWCDCGTFNYISDSNQAGRITSLNIKDSIKIVDYNEYFEYKKESLDNKNIMEGITKIPQHIKVKENYTNHTITVLKGSEVFVPNGFEADGTTPHFDVKVLDKDYIDSDFTGNKRVFGVYNVQKDTINTAYTNRISNTSIGSTSGTGNIPTASTHLHCLYYKVDTNILYWIDENGAYPCSLPLYCDRIFSDSNDKDIHHLFNGWCNVGGYVFILPGLEFITPDGKYEDGTNKNIKRVVERVLCGNWTNRGYDYLLIDRNFNIYAWNNSNIYYDYWPTPAQGHWYLVFDTKRNMIFRSDDGGSYYQIWVAYLGMFYHTPDSNASFEGILERPAFQAVDMFDVKTIVNIMYPIGSVYLEANNLGMCPIQTLLPTSRWELVSTNMALWGGNGTNATTTKAAGLPNIKGNIGNLCVSVSGEAQTPAAPTGAFSATRSAMVGGNQAGQGRWIGYLDGTNINASRSSNVYKDSVTTVQPPAYVVNVWRRIA